MKKLIYILSLCFAVFVLSSCQKTELDDLKPMQINSEERVDSENFIPPGKGSGDDEIGDSGSDGEPTDGITDDDDEDDDDEMEGRVTESDNP